MSLGRFYTVRQSSLAAKLARLEIPDNLYNWLVDYLLGRQHATKFAGKLSEVASIWASVVQGSGVGPSEYDVYVSDLHPRNAINTSTPCEQSARLRPSKHPAWWGYDDEADRTRIGRFMRRLLKAGFTSTIDADIDASIS